MLGALQRGECCPKVSLLMAGKYLQGCYLSGGDDVAAPLYLCGVWGGDAPGCPGCLWYPGDAVCDGCAPTTIPMYLCDVWGGDAPGSGMSWLSVVPWGCCM